ncbi:MAG TPA: DUF4294 domain-containing protein [Chitinophagaceae bacterium]|nr:DUF4294 domain-containing protein [Chitinophagaceae bacterium]
MSLFLIDFLFLFVMYLRYIYFFLLFLFSFQTTQAQEDTSVQRRSKYGPNDTIIVPVYNYNGEFIPYRELPEVFVCNCDEKTMKKIAAEWTRLRNAVYVTYPYAVAAGRVFNDINAQLQRMEGRKDKKLYIKSREKELKKEFSDKLQDLSVYQGKVLMKLIYRETNNDCYHIIKELKGGLTARFWQSILFFFGTSLKQDYNPEEDKFDRQISIVLKELEASSYGYYYRNYGYYGR